MKIFCTRCGTQKEDKRYFCTYCGYRDPYYNFGGTRKAVPQAVQKNKDVLNMLKTLE